MQGFLEHGEGKIQTGVLKIGWMALQGTPRTSNGPTYSSTEWLRKGSEQVGLAMLVLLAGV